MKQRIIGALLPVFLGLLPLAAVFINENSATGIILVLVLLFLLEKNKGKNYKKFKYFLTPYLVSVSVFILYALLSPDIKLGLKVLERQSPMLIIPIIVFCSNTNFSRMRIFLLSFLAGMLLISVVSFSYLLWFYENYSDWVSVMNDVQQANTYLQYKFPHLIGTHPTYWSYLLIISNIVLLNNREFHIIRKRSLIVIGLLVFNGTLLYLSSRTAIGINLLIHIAALALYLRREKISAKGKIAVFGIGLMAFVFMVNSPLFKAKIVSISSDERMYLWPVAIEKIQENYYILGEGLGQGREVLKKYIIANGDQRVNYHSFDLHNQYLRHYLDMGLLGITALLFLILFPFFQVNKRDVFKKHIICSFTIFYVLCLFTEASLYRFKGVIIFSLFSAVFMLLDYQKNVLAKETL
ncbi:O-antigen ligase family protein [Eudoraea chungangensis]|uniref:O-antigen ligase family protein n=1 Tax=Eudoraea chungangensis TaxID=1481905 RepID=UPI0023EE277C|nr:O-antigen ligase family protein [Eudoraea chungangensis]